MIDIQEVKVPKILNPTAIDLGDYVINPYKGCELACLYCYVRNNRVVRNETRKWGTYVDVRLNAPERLEKELSVKKPQKVLLGSTTECFQPIESKYRLTQKILDILNSHKVYYSILTRSPAVLEYASLLNKGYCKNIYFTINDYSESLKKVLEPKSAPFYDRIETVKKLRQENVPVVPYVSPLLPYITNVENIFIKLKEFDNIGFEGLNFNLGSIDNIISAVGNYYPNLKPLYQKMRSGLAEYNNAFGSIRKIIMKEAIKSKKTADIYFHELYGYFDNKYG